MIHYNDDLPIKFSNSFLALRGPVGVSIALTVATVFCSLYFYLWQTYVLHIDQTMISMFTNVDFILIFHFSNLLGAYRTWNFDEVCCPEWLRIKKILFSVF